MFFICRSTGLLQRRDQALDIGSRYRNGICTFTVDSCFGLLVAYDYYSEDISTGS